MSLLEKYDLVFIESFSIEKDSLSDLKYQSISAWDSVGHMALMNALEEAFNIEIDIDDIIDFSSYETGRSILAKYNVSL
jgi:acyl carrier protein